MPSERRVCLPTDDKFVERALDAEIARLASRQHGVVATRQLAALGLARGGVAARGQAGRLHRVHRGVYAVGHPVLTVNGRRVAAVLAAGPSAVLSHASAAALWEIRPTSATRIDVSVRSKGGRGKRPGLRIHRATRLRDDEITEHQGIRVTTPARTLLDLAATLPRRALERALDQAEIRDLYDLSSLDALARAHAGERGARRLQRALDEDGDPTLTDSELEELMLALCDEHRSNAPSRKHGSPASESTSSSPPADSSSKPTATATTAPGAPSSATASATPSSPAPATACCGSPTASSRASRRWWRRPSPRR